MNLMSVDEVIANLSSELKTLSEEKAMLQAEHNDWKRAYTEVKELHDNALLKIKNDRDKITALSVQLKESQDNDRIAMAWIADIKAAVGCEHMDMPQLVEYLKTMKLRNTDEH